MAKNEKIVLCTYKPKAGKTQALLDVLSDHVPTLRMLGFASGHPRSISTSENGTILEIFAWMSDEAARAAHDHPEVKKIWGQIAELADMVPLSELAETKKPFAHFTSTQNTRTTRPMWFEIPADEPMRCIRFYEKVFGWQATRFGEEIEYWTLDTGAEPSPGIDGGITKRESPHERVRNTVRVDSVDDYVKKIEAAGGTIIVPKTKIERVGLIAYAKDTEGNVFGLIQPDCREQA
jgi:predicted enzyme related to lactoylglutathione lyase